MTVVLWAALLAVCGPALIQFLIIQAVFGISVLDHRVLAHYGGDVTQVNMQPRLRAKVLARYGAPA